MTHNISAASINDSIIQRKNKTNKPSKAESDTLKCAENVCFQIKKNMKVHVHIHRISM